jgi:hypothetical protein
MGKRRGEVVAIKDLFAKYKQTLIAPQKTVEMEVVRVVGELVGCTLREDQVKYTVSTRTVSLRVPALVRQEILLKKQEVLKALALALGAKNSPLHIV